MKPPSELSLDLLRTALSVAEGPSLTVGGVMLAGRRGRRYRRLAELGGLKPAGRSRSIICQECERRHRAAVTFDPERQATTHFCPEAGRVTIDPSSIEVYELQLDWLLGWLSEALRLSKNEDPITWIEGSLWELGHATIGGQRLRIFFGRRISSVDQLERVEAKLVRRVDNGTTGVVLTASPSFRSPYRLPGAFSILDLDEVLDVVAHSVTVDRRRLLALAELEATVSPYKIGAPGRPTGAALLNAEHRRRLDNGQASRSIGKEAKALAAWYDQEHGSVAALKPRSIENIIREAHNAHWACRK